MTEREMHCPLCRQQGQPFYGDEFLVCPRCAGIYKEEKYYLDAEAEQRRYETHNNDVNDARYQEFTSPITRYVLENFAPSHSGLDFGSGTAPVISKVLQDHGYNICQYDPFFADDVTLLNRTYDYIVSCEVIEHFHHPRAEFERLRAMLKTKGALVCMTHVYDEGIDFKHWYYKNDPTHVFIYRQETIAYIAAQYGFADFTIENRLIVLKA